MNTMYRTGILRKLARSKAFKGITFLMVLEMLIQTVNPVYVMALTSGPTQPEVEGFQPIGVTDMVDPFTGDFSYNIPLMQVGDYPLNLAYQGGVTMDDEASWTGLGWNVHTGVITRQMRGIPDDFWGDEIQRHVYMRDNLTIGAKILLGFETFGVDLSDVGLDLGVGIDASYNTYRGIALGTSTNVGLNLEGSGLPMNLGLSMSSGPEGLNISPNISFSAKLGNESSKTSGELNLGFGFDINSRSGLKSMSLSGSASATGNNIGSFYSGSLGSISHSASIDLGQPTFTPKIEFPMKNFAASGKFKIGGGAFGQDIDLTIVGYGSTQKLAKNHMYNASYGYMYSEKANNNPDAVHDFNREKDGSFTKEKKNLPLTNYTHDIYSISAQGLGGTFRAYRNDAGYVYDKRAFSPSTSVDFGVEIGPGQLIDLGVDGTGNRLESESKGWTQSNAAAEKLTFRAKQVDEIKENFHFKLTGEKNVEADPDHYNNLGSHGPVSVQLDNDQKNFEVPAYNKFVVPGSSPLNFNNPHRSERQPRNTAVYHLTKKEVLRAYPWKAKYISEHAKDHHIAEIVVIQPDGKRYVFSLAAYNRTQREISFNVGEGNVGSTGSLVGPNSASSGIVQGATQANIELGVKKRGIDHFYDETVTPAYAHSWMLTEVLSADYVDVTGNGPTSDDLGTYTKFNYGKTTSGGGIEPDIKNFPWRTPITGDNQASASYMEGLKTDKTDDKANIIYGEKDIWYVHSIESKTQIAVFETSPRSDGLGSSIDGALATTLPLQQLDKIKLYSKPEYDYDAVAAIPLKTVHFKYDYSLCKGTPNSNGAGQGKLTLKKVFFTYKNARDGEYSPYEFGYKTHAGTTELTYKFGEVDRWGTYKPASQAPSGLTKSEYPYSVQDKTIRDEYSAAWHLNQITLPSGGKINVQYESDDYAFVQDKDAMRMFKVLGMVKDPYDDDESYSNKVFNDPINANSMRDYIVVQLDEEMSSSAEFREKYLKGHGKGNHENHPLKQLYFRFMLNVNSLNFPTNPSNPEFEFVSGYAEIDDISECGLWRGLNDKAYIKVKTVNTRIAGIPSEVSPFAFAGWQFSRLNTPRKAFNQAEPTDPPVDQFIQTLASADMFSQLVQFFQGPNGRMMSQGFAARMEPKGSWVRLLDPDKNKLGGGNRVKEITISDEWGTVSPNEATAQYGQVFNYQTDEGYSSGVASYEPGVGADENPWRVAVFYSGPRQMLIPEERYYMEEPFGESFFPGPSVGYSKVTVRDKTFDPDVTLNKTGKTVHEFYTAFDFPTYSRHTPLEAQPRKSSVLGQLLKVNARNYMTASQGYTVYLNDMHGKPKAQSMYAEGASAPFAYTKYHYKTNSGGGLENDVVVLDEQGMVDVKPVGMEMDFVADMREQSTVGQTIAVTANVASMLFGIYPAVVPTVFGSYNKERTRFRSAVTTKVVYRFGIQDRTETFDKGAYVETRITAFDAKTGNPIVQELNNEFKDKYYKTDYPAHWAYTGMGQASQNIGYMFSDATFASDGSFTDTHLEPGDEVLPLGQRAYGRKGSAYPAPNANTVRYWVSLDEATGKKFLINNLGDIYKPVPQEKFTVIRSGHRNMHSMPIGSVTSVKDPIVSGHVAFDVGSQVVAASAMEYSEHWKTDAHFLKPVNTTTSYQVYDQNAKDLIALLNEMITRDKLAVGFPGEPILPDGFPQLGRLFPNCKKDICGPFIYQSNYAYVCTDPNTLGYLPPPWNDVNYPVAALGFQFYPNQCQTSVELPVNTGGPPEVVEGQTIYPATTVALPINQSEAYQNCACGKITLFPVDNCSTFGYSDWDDVLYFEDDDFTIVGNPTSSNTIYNIASQYVVLKAVFPGGVTRNVMLTFTCWPFENTIETVTSTTYECSYSSGDVINPYLYGILGNWRAKADYFFMGDRNNTDASTAENLRTDGYLPGFKAYWKAPASSTDVWVRNEPAVVLGNYENWNWKTEMTIYSPFGYDLENINPLPAFSSAQYGYQNMLPLAVANNAMQKEIGYDGFEDYYPWIPKPVCTKDHFKFEEYEDNISYQVAHTGECSMGITDGNKLQRSFAITSPYVAPQNRTVPYVLESNDLLSGFAPNLNIMSPLDPEKYQKYVLCFWAKTETRNPVEFDYTGIAPIVMVNSSSVIVPGSLKKSKLINDWQRYEVLFTIPAYTSAPSTIPELLLQIENTSGQKIYVDDIRVHPFEANLKSFVYGMYDLRYNAQLDENNFATFYEYDEEGKLVRTKKETERGIMTLQENRSNTYKR